MSVKFPPFDADRVVFNGSDFVIYDISDMLPRHKNYPHGTDAMRPVSDGEGGMKQVRAIPAHWKYGSRGHNILKAFVHQTAGSYKPGFEGVYNTAAFIVRDPTYFANGKWRGTGRGWPAMCYSYFFPFKPEMTPDGKRIIFMCIPNDRKSWHTAGHNNEAIALGFQGYFKSRHMGGSFQPLKGGNPEGNPSHDQILMLTASWNEYFTRELPLNDADMFGHFEAKKPKLACPGDYLETHVLSIRAGAGSGSTDITRKQAIAATQSDVAPPTYKYPLGANLITLSKSLFSVRITCALNHCFC